MCETEFVSKLFENQKSDQKIVNYISRIIQKHFGKSVPNINWVKFDYFKVELPDYENMDIKTTNLHKINIRHSSYKVTSSDADESLVEGNKLHTEDCWMTLTDGNQFSFPRNFTAEFP